TLEHVGIGSIVFSPLEQGILTSKYLDGIPKDSRAATQGSYLDSSQISNNVIKQVRELNEIAMKRGQSLAQMAVAWLLKDPRVTSVLIGVSKKEQLLDNIKAIENIKFSESELKEIDSVLK
ncbi:aldo/keto reductase, partial [Christiangramia aquimixticola]|uniref:aldo/keto reductase n=1 Tax=Christiangramia aquimixticola TaxID=1697558 RepID=UPI003AA93303